MRRWRAIPFKHAKYDQCPKVIFPSNEPLVKRLRVRSMVKLPACTASDDLLFLDREKWEGFRHNLSGRSRGDLVTVSRRPSRRADTRACCLVDVDVRNVRESTELGAIAWANQIMLRGVERRFFGLEFPIER
jgi:hypothetical protein